MNHLTVFGFFIVLVFVIGIVSTAYAHPHSTTELMESHSHVLADKKFHDNFLIHTFDQVILSFADFVTGIFFSWG